MKKSATQRLRNFSISKCVTLTALFQWTLLATLLLPNSMSSASATLSPETANDEANMAPAASVDAMYPGYGAKRNWQSLQGAWGKRSSDTGISAEVTDANDNVYFAERRVPLPTNNAENTDPVLHYSLVYIKNGAGLFDRFLNAEDNNELSTDARANENSDPMMQYETERDGSADADDMLLNEKRAWKSMNVAWGKRRNAPQWNKFRGAWGKRDPSWNNLKGMWGKRSKDWQKLHGSWGKRMN